MPAFDWPHPTYVILIVTFLISFFLYLIRIHHKHAFICTHNLHRENRFFVFPSSLAYSLLVRWRNIFLLLGRFSFICFFFFYCILLPFLISRLLRWIACEFGSLCEPIGWAPIRTSHVNHLTHLFVSPHPRIIFVPSIFLIGSPPYLYKYHLIFGLSSSWAWVLVLVFIVST